MKLFYNRCLWYIAENKQHAHELCSSDFLRNRLTFVPAAIDWEEVDGSVTIHFPLSPTEPLIPDNAISQIIPEANMSEVTANAKDWCKRYGCGFLASYEAD